MNRFQKLATATTVLTAVSAAPALAGSHLTIAFDNGKCVTGETSVYVGKNNYVIPSRMEKVHQEFLSVRLN